MRPAVALAGLQRGGLAGAVGPEHRGDGVALDGEVEPVDGHLLAVPHHEAGDLDRRRVGHRLSLGSAPGRSPAGQTGVTTRRCWRRCTARLTPPEASAGSHASTALSATAAVAATHGRPRATSATTSAPSRGLAPLGPGTAGRHLAGAERAEQGERRERVPGGSDRAEQQAGDGQLVAEREDERDQQAGASGRAPRGIRPGRQRCTSEARDDQHDADASATSSIRVGSGGAANATNAARPDGADDRSVPTLVEGVAAARGRTG